ncbi:MAG: MarR family transcriptional regulator [Thaumarchaeota archaeon]|nr:MarR family transcriptional regulator [Nitrososphaerota archaeon]
MLVDIDVGMILAIVASFVIGLVCIVVYNKIKPRLVSQSNDLKILIERVQYYENLLIDMKIRLDSLELVNEPEELVQAQTPRPREEKRGPDAVIEIKEEKSKVRVHNMNFGSATEYVLRLITEKPMTSRDIQVTIGRSREHTSRMMKKLFEEGLVERDMQIKPFTYKITQKGLTRLGTLKAPPMQ